MVSPTPMPTGFEATIPVRGDLCLLVRDATTHEVRWRYEIRNTIMYSALKGLVSLIAQKTTSTPADSAVAYLRVGTGTTAPVRSNLDLQLPAPNAITPHTLLFGDAQKYLTVSNPFEMKIVTTLEAGDLNGLSLTEAGLFIRGGTVATPVGSPAVYTGAPTYYPELFARQIHPAIAKSSGLIIDYEWRISFAA